MTCDNFCQKKYKIVIDGLWPIFNFIKNHPPTHPPTPTHPQEKFQLKPGRGKKKMIKNHLREALKKTKNLGFWLNLNWNLPTFKTWTPLTGAIFYWFEMI